MPEPSEQREVLEFLGAAATYGGTAPVRIDTHGTIVFLAGENAFKIKRAIRYPYMDFSSLTKRKQACEAELAVNRKFAPDIYLGVLPITKAGDRLQIGGTGTAVEWCVHMRRFDETATLDRLAERHAIDDAMIDKLAAIIADSHRNALVHHPDDLAADTARRIDQILSDLTSQCNASHSETIADLPELIWKDYRRNQPLLHRRSAAGRVRRCHGDLHLRNIVSIRGQPQLFDAIEFDDRIATIDTLYDLAFLLMDLCNRGLQSQACRLLNNYLWNDEKGREDLAGLSLLPLYMAMRACIRAMVTLTQQRYGAKQETLDVPALLKSATSYLAASPCQVIAIGGLSGSGKSSVATELAPMLGSAPGAIHLRSDVIRKQLAGVSPQTPLPQASYDSRTTELVYRELCEMGETVLQSGRTVILDATFLERERRSQAASVASRHNVPFHGFWLDAPLATLEARIRARRGDASDATVQVLRRQTSSASKPTEWTVCNANGPVKDTALGINKFVTGGKRV